MNSSSLREDPAASVARRLNDAVLARTGSTVRDLSVTTRVDDCRVLSGKVCSYYMKQIVQVVARELAPDVRWENRIAVFNG